MRGIMTLLENLLSNDVATRQDALRTFADLDDISDLIEPLIEEVEYGTWKARSRALHALSWVKDERLIEPLLEFAKDPKLRPAALRAMGHYPEDDDVMTTLEKALRQPDDDVVRESAIEALGDTRSWKAYGPLIRFINANKKSPDPLNLVPMAIRTLGALGDKRAIEPLERLLIDAEYERREAILEALDTLRQGN